MFKKIIAGVLSLTVAVSCCSLPETKSVHAAGGSLEQQLELEDREMEAELRKACDSEFREERYPQMEEEQYLNLEADFSSGTTDYYEPETGMLGEAAFSDGTADFFTDGKPGESTEPEGPIDPEGPTDPEEPEEPTEPEKPTDPEAPINPEEPYNPEVPEGVREVTLDVAEGEDIAWKLNGMLIKMKDRATDEAPCKVIIPPGNYTVTKTICTYSNIHIYAVGAKITKTSPEKRMLLRLGNKEGSEGGYDGYRNVTIEGGTWDINFETIPNKEEPGGCTGFRLGHATNVLIKDVTLLNSLKSHLVELAGIKNARITGCTFSGYWLPYEGGAQECIQMDICHEKYFPNYSPSDRSVCENIYIEGNTFENAFAGVGCHSMSFGKPFKSIVIRNNTFRNIRKRAVWLTNSVDSVVEKNSMLNVGGGVYARSMYSHCAYINEGQNAVSTGNQYPMNLTVRNNEIVLNKPEVIGEGPWKSFGIYLGGENCVSAENNIPDGVYPIKNVTVVNNKISGPGKGVVCVLAEKSRISDNVLELEKEPEYGNMGIILGGSNYNTVAKNEIRGCSGPGIYIYRGTSKYSRPGKYNTASANVISDCSGDGIAVNRTCDRAKVEKNTVTDVTGNGISVWSNTKTSVTGNKISKCAASGIMVAEGDGTYVEGNRVSASAGDGIRTDEKNKRLSVKRNTISKSSGDGIMMGGGNESVISENTITSGKKNGISIANSKSVSVYKNTIKSNKAYGIIGKNSSVKTLKSNTLKKNGYTNAIYAINTSLPY